MWRLYGLKNCDACRKASAWLKAHQRACEFHDLRDMELTAELLAAWESRLGWEKLLNRQSTTWRGLDASERADLDQTRAIDLMRRYPALIKRPLLIAGDTLLLGFSPERYAELP